MSKIERYIQIILSRVLWGIAIAIVIMTVLYLLPQPTYTIHDITTTRNEYKVGDDINARVKFSAYRGQTVTENSSIKCGQDIYPIKQIIFQPTPAREVSVVLDKGTVPAGIDPHTCQLRLDTAVSYKILFALQKTVYNTVFSNSFNVTK